MLTRSTRTWGLMGINKLPEIRDYWSTNEFLCYAPIADRISRDRFEQITRYLHFVDSDTLQTIQASVGYREWTPSLTI